MVVVVAVSRQQYAFEFGKQGEAFFEQLCINNSLPYTTVHTWYDYGIYDYKVEIKSCSLLVKNNPTRYKTGRWDFTNTEQTRKLKEDNSWVCLLIQHQNQYLIYGFLEGKYLPKERYISLPKAHNLETITLEEWKERLVPF